MEQSTAVALFTRQDTFDAVASYLLRVGRRSYHFLGCRYRASKEAQERKGSAPYCAVGCLIPDRDYLRSFEGLSVGSSPELRAVLTRIGHDIELVADLQVIHDTQAPQSWAKYLARLAVRTGLLFDHDRMLELGAERWAHVSPAK